MKIKTRFIKQTTITLSEMDLQNLKTDYQMLKSLRESNDMPATMEIIENLIEIQTPRNYLD